MRGTNERTFEILIRTQRYFCKTPQQLRFDDHQPWTCWSA